MSDKKTDDATKYSKLIGGVNYDREAVEQLAEASNEIIALEARANQLKQIVNEHEDIQQFVWRTAENVFIPLHKLEDEHLSNIMLHLLNNHRPITRSIRAEATRRGLTVPVQGNVYTAEMGALRSIAEGMAELERDLGF